MGLFISIYIYIYVFSSSFIELRKEYMRSNYKAYAQRNWQSPDTQTSTKPSKSLQRLKKQLVGKQKADQKLHLPRCIKRVFLILFSLMLTVVLLFFK